MTYQTVFDLHQKDPVPHVGVGITVAIVVSISVLLLVAVKLARVRGSGQRIARQLLASTFAVSLLALMLFAVSLLSIVDIRRHNQLLNELTTGHAEVVEGIVTDFVPMPYAGHAYESFCVAGRCFRYSDFDHTGGGFNNTSSHGGPVREGQSVRVTHLGNTIVRLEIGVRNQVAPSPNPSLQRTPPG